MGNIDAPTWTGIRLRSSAGPKISDHNVMQPMRDYVHTAIKDKCVIVFQVWSYLALGRGKSDASSLRLQGETDTTERCCLLFRSTVMRLSEA